MSIFPATDIVSDVARAADPNKLQLAIKRLDEIGGEKSRVAAGNAFTLSSTKDPATKPVRLSHGGDLAPATAQRLDTLTPTQKFEAFLLQSWLEDVLPQAKSGVYGTQAGADIWRSMMAEQISYQLARADVVGLHKLMDHKNSVLAAKSA